MYINTIKMQLNLAGSARLHRLHRRPKVSVASVVDTAESFQRLGPSTLLTGRI